MNTTTRVNLALAACEGLSDQELAARGNAAFAKMITRKRMYSAAARKTAAAALKLQDQVGELQAQLAAVQANYDAMVAQGLEADVSDLSQAQELLQKVMK